MLLLSCLHCGDKEDKFLSLVGEWEISGCEMCECVSTHQFDDYPKPRAQYYDPELPLRVF